MFEVIKIIYIYIYIRKTWNSDWFSH